MHSMDLEGKIMSYKFIAVLGQDN